MSAPGARSPWPSVLLSGLLWPGAGQMRNGQWTRGLLFALATLAVLARLAWRVAAETLEALLAAPAPPSFLDMWALAEGIRRRNAAELSGLTLLLLVLWGASVVDAWWQAKRAPGGR